MSRALSAVLAGILVAVATAQLTRESKLQSRIQTAFGSDFCVRLFTRSGDIGCRAPRKGVSAHLYPVDTEADLTELEREGVAAPAVLLLPQRLLNATWPARLYAKHLVAGAVACSVPGEPAGSPMEPSAEFPNGAGTVLSSLPFPIVLAESADCLSLRRNLGADPAAMRARRRALQRPLVRAPAASISAYMGPAAMTAPKCLRAGRCLPVGGQSVWASVTPLRPGAETVLVATALDAPALFHAVSPAVSDAAAALTVLAAAAAALVRAPDASALPRGVVFAGFQGEAWHRVGSRAFFRDVTAFTCAHAVPATASPTRSPLCARPLALDTSFAALNASRVSSALFLRGLVAPADVPESLFSRATEGAAASGSAAAALHAAAQSIGLAAQAGAPSPRFSAVQSLAAERGAPVDGAVVSAFPGAWPVDGFATPRDADLAVLNHTRLARLATAIARAAHSLAGGTDPARSRVSVSAADVASLVPCFTTDGAGCAAVREAAPWRARAAAPVASYYAGVFGTPRQPYAMRQTAAASFWSSARYGFSPLGFRDGWRDGDQIVATYEPVEEALAVLLGRALAAAPGAATGPACAKDDDCPRPLVCAPGARRCTNATVHFHNAVSPALAPTEDFGWDLATATRPDDMDDPLYSEPFWGPPTGPPLSATSFLLDTTLEAGFVAVIGVAIACAISVAAWTFREQFLEKRKWL